ncbi:hypothetical protein ACFLW0_02865 [Chloroflexota bacterium]
MTPPEKREEMMQMLAASEEAVGRLYDAYAGRFPEHEEFWLGLAMEEADHANTVFDLMRKVKDGSASFFESRLSVEKVQELQGHLGRQLARVKKEKISFADALSVAVDIEKSLSEHKYYWFFSGASEEVQELLDYLDSATQNHIKVLEREVERWGRGK